MRQANKDLILFDNIVEKINREKFIGNINGMRILEETSKTLRKNS